jgi:hypothetical protein
VKARRIDPLSRARCQRGPLVLGLPISLAAPKTLVEIEAEPKGDEEHDGAEGEVDDRVDGALGGVGGDEALRGEDEHQANGDAHRVRAEQVADHQPLRTRRDEHDRHDREQRRVPRREEGEDEDLADSRGRL